MLVSIALFVARACLATACPVAMTVCSGIGTICGANSCCEGMGTRCGAHSVCSGISSLCGPNSQCTGINSHCGLGSSCSGLGATCKMPNMPPMPTMAPMPTFPPMPTFAPMPTFPPIPTAPSGNLHIHNYGCDMGPACTGRESLSQVDGYAFCCPADEPDCQVSVSQTGSELTATCASSLGFSEHVQESGFAWFASTGLVGVCMVALLLVAIAVQWRSMRSSRVVNPPGHVLG